jgi:prepilin-type N-terminal cleavage/methylation domain-containing protein
MESKMAARGPGRDDRRAFTIVEMLITLAMIGIIAAFIGSLYVHARAKSRALRCLHNQQQVSRALIAFYTDKGRFPEDTPNTDLALQLGNYIPWPQKQHSVSVPETYRCPNDPRGPTFNSYQEYYVQRKEPAGGESFVMGCPRHNDAEASWVNLFGTGDSLRLRPGQITVNGAAVAGDSAAPARSTTNGTLTFEDGSSVTATGSAASYSVTAVASFRMQDGRLYTVVRVTGKGEAKFSVTPGSAFEVITPVALIGVQGTEFTVTTDAAYTRVDLTHGSVRVWDRLTRQERLMRNTGSFTAGSQPLPACVACAQHCVGGAHCRRCPLHVGVPQNIGTGLCVVCPLHCPPARPGMAHRCHFCPLNEGYHED